MTGKLCIIILSITLSFFSLNAQQRKIEPNQVLSIADGLAHNGVTSICEDSKGYLWIGTYDGLNRYDGYEFKVFKNTPTQKLFVSNRIRSVVEDEKGNLWLGTDEGISIYNYSKEKFDDIYSNKQTGVKPTGPVIRDILVKTQSDTIICTTEGEGVLVFRKDYTFIKRIVPPSGFANRIVSFFNGYVLDKNNYLFVSDAGLIHFDLKAEKFERLIPDGIGQHNSILKLDKEKFLVTVANGVILATIHKEGNSYQFHFESVKNSKGQFRRAAIDNNGNIWLSILNQGLVRLDKSILLEKKELQIKSIFRPHRGLYRASCIYIDDNSGCWVGTFDKGIYRFTIHENPFHTYGADVPYDFSVSSGRVTHISAFDANKILVTSQGSGLTLYNTLNHRFENLPAGLAKVNSSNLTSVFVDSKKDIWLNFSDKKGFCRYKRSSGKLESISRKFNFTDELAGIRSIDEDINGNIWIANIDDVYRINITPNGTITGVESLEDNPFFNKRSISLYRCLYGDSNYNIVWVGTSTDGLLRVNIDNPDSLKNLPIDQYEHDYDDRTSISSNFISCITRLPNGELWLGTERGGICKMVKSTENHPEFVNYSEDEGLSNNVVKTIRYDNNNNLWISTNIGLNKFDTSKNQFRIFRKDNGLPFEDFYYSSEKLDNGYLVFSGLNGFCYFNPKNVPDKEQLPKLGFNNFKIFNKIIAPGDSINKRVVLQNSLEDTKEIILKHNENVFSIDMSSLHYSTPENHFLRYQLSPINEEWIVVPSNQRTINYNGLQPGEYELRVMASNSINEWTAPKTLKIIIKPPFWRTVPAYILYVLLVALVIYSVMYYLLRLNRLRHNLEIEHMEKENVKAVNAAKLRFFSNISHEIKTPLTLISGPINQMAERYRGNSELYNKLHIVQRQSKKISQLVDQVHDFQRADANKLKMNYTVFYFNGFITEICEDFRFLAETDDKTLKVADAPSKIYVSADKDKLEKILNNLLNNAFKYSSTKDSVTVSYTADEKYLQIEVSDTGRGIAPDDLPHIFERFYQSKHKHSAYTGGSGIGLAFTKRLVEMHYGYISAESWQGKGTTITVKLPVITEAPVNADQSTEEYILSVEKENDIDLHVPAPVSVEKIKVDGSFANAVIFYVEDNTEMRNYVNDILLSFFEVQSFPDGRACLNAMEKEWPDIIVSDVLMPELNGFELCKAVKSDMKTSHIPVILLTACISIEEQIKGLEVGADSYIKKPFNVQHLITRVETLLQNRKQLRERYQIDFPLKLDNSEDSSNDVSFLEKLYHLMEENLDNTDLDMDKFAKKLYLNRTHFYQKVKALTNKTPFELLKMYRLKRAAELLVQKQLSVNEVYVMTGFKSRSNFSKLFKERYEITPGKYATETLKKLE